LGILESDFDDFECQLQSIDREILWPNTPIGGTHQNIIPRRTGSKDNWLWHPASRGRKLISSIKSVGLEENSFFSLLDIGCGDAVLIGAIKEKFPEAVISGFDANLGFFKSHGEVQAKGVRLMRGFIQNAVHYKFSTKLDFAVMLNSYRSWESAQLNLEDLNLQAKLDSWLIENFKYAILTLSPVQIRSFFQLGRSISIIGRGEDDSKFIIWRTNP
jgi:hypothetical protein